MGRTLSSEEREKALAEDIWLNYFNRYLFEHGTISKREYKIMVEKIASRKSKKSRKWNRKNIKIYGGIYIVWV